MKTAFSGVGTYFPYERLVSIRNASIGIVFIFLANVELWNSEKRSYSEFLRASCWKFMVSIFLMWFVFRSMS
jgi:hypothetical protein